MDERVAIIGAGIAGIAAARTFAAAGWRPVLFDKSRGLGGRMATRRAEGLRFDHGTPHVNAAGPALTDLLADARRADVAAPWVGGGLVGKPGVSALARWAVGDLPVVAACPVSTLIRGPNGWTVATDDGPAETPGNDEFGCVVVAVPAPQAAPILATGGDRFPALAATSYAPCWTLMVALDKAVDLPEGRRDCSDPMIGKIIHETTKPSRDGAAASLVAHATPAWSRAHLERDKETVADEMLAHLRDLLKIDAAPVFHVAHRWRFAEVETAANVPFVWDNDRGLGACGDWCQGSGVEGAFESGAALAAAILASLQP